MKKYSVLLAIFALVLASLACQTVMGGGNGFQTPEEHTRRERPPETVFKQAKYPVPLRRFAPVGERIGESKGHKTGKKLTGQCCQKAH